MLTVLRRVFSFSDWYGSHPKEPPPGDMLDASFDAQNQRIAEIEALVETIRRSDGALQNAIVTRDAMHPDIYGDLRHEMRLGAAAEALRTENFAKRAENAALNAENSVFSAINAENSARADANAISSARNSQISRLEAVIAESRAILAELDAKSAELLEAESHAGHSEAWAVTSAQWAEHMPDTLPESALVSMDVTGDQHWSSKWWASKAAAAFGSLAELYLGAHPVPPLTTSTGEEIPLGAIYYNTVTGQIYVWDGTQWVSMTQPQRAGLATLWYNATDGQTVFPFAVTDLNGNSYSLDIDDTEGVDAHVNGIKLMPAEVSEGDWTLDAAASTVTFLRPLRLGDIVSFDILLANTKLGPGAVNAWSLALVEPKDGSRVTFTLVMEDVAGPTVTVAKNEELLVSVDGVVQEPGVSYMAAGTSITFGLAPAADSWVFITWFRSEGGTGVMTTTGAVDWTDITGKPSTFPPTVPIAQADITGLTADLDAKVGVAGDTMTGMLDLPQGSVTVPALTLGTGNSGLYATGTGSTAIFSFAVNGTARLSVGQNTITLTTTLRNASGSVGTPSISFVNETTSGLYRAGSGDVRLSMGGADAVKWLSSDKSTQFLGPVGFYGVTPVARGALAAPTGTVTRTTFVTSSVTLPQLAERVNAMIVDLRALGLFS